MSQAVTEEGCTRPWQGRMYGGGMALVAVALTAYFTHYLDEASRTSWESVLKKNKDELARVVLDVKSHRQIADQHGHFSVPSELSGVCGIEKKEAFLVFTLRSGWLDDPIQELVFDMDDDRPSTKGVRALFNLLSDRPIYQVQYVGNGWYYCKYN